MCGGKPRLAQTCIFIVNLCNYVKLLELFCEMFNVFWIVVFGMSGLLENEYFTSKICTVEGYKCS